jgi:hypothetical protein
MRRKDADYDEWEIDEIRGEKSATPASTAVKAVETKKR